MDSMLVAVAGLLFLGVGIGIGLLIRRGAISAARSSARQDADRELAVLGEQLRARDIALAEAKRSATETAATLEAERTRVTALSAELARAQAETAQVAPLRSAVDEGAKALKNAQERAAASSVENAQNAARASELDARVGELKAEVASLQSGLEQARRECAAALERLASMQAELEGTEKRRQEVATELDSARAAHAKLETDLEEHRGMLGTAQRDLATARAELASSDQSVKKVAEELRAAQQRVDVLEQESKRLTEARASLTADLEAERRAAQERKEEAEKAREQVRAEVEKLTGRLLEQQGKTMLERSREGLEALLTPLGEKLKDFEQKVEKTYDAENRERASLREQLKALQEAQSHLHKDAEALSKALTRDSKQQGDWGEIVLERVLEVAGLTKGREYDLQVSHTDDEGGRKRPDALVYLPENRAVIVDAKCSLTAFVEASRALSEEDRDRALDAHLASLRSHIKSLASKNYTDVLQQRSLDFVMMFVPSEAAFFAGLSREPTLYEEAFRQGVVLCSPTTLIAALRLVAQLWRTESQNQNARKIAEEAGKLLDKLSAFVGDLDAVGDRLSRAQESFASARAKLSTGRGNVLRRAANIAELGAPVKTDKVRALLTNGVVEDELEDLQDAAPEVAPPRRVLAKDEVS